MMENPRPRLLPFTMDTAAEKVRLAEDGVTLRYEDYRRFLLHVLPRGFHRIRHYGLLASTARRDNLALARRLLAVAPVPECQSLQSCPIPARHARVAAGA